MNFKKTSLRIWLVVLGLILISYPNFLFALPEGESIVSGSATFDRSESNTLSITTLSDKLIVNYNSFNIAGHEVVRFVQPSSNAVVLNRVTGVDPSSIMGTLTANGKIFLVNPNGVLFGPNSRVDVAGLLASTLDITDTDFLNGNYVFQKSGKPGYIINQGEITAQPGGYVVLLSQAISNKMSILADLGTVVLASGEKMTLSLDDNSAISVVIDEAVEEEVFGPDGQKMTSAIDNSGTIKADGGKVMLTAKVLNNVFDHAINNQGLIQAKSLESHNGVIELVAEGAPIANSGTIEADKVTITSKDAHVINTGTIISPDITIKVDEAEFTNAEQGKIIAEVTQAQVSPVQVNESKILIQAGTVLQQGVISADGSQMQVNGGEVIINAKTILQQGLISANAFEGGNAGKIEIVSETSTVLDERSSTQARAMGVVGSGGRILIDSLRGNTLVNKNAVIDVSAGAISGNAGFVEVSAFTQLGFHGVLNGRAPPGYTPATILFDPYDVLIKQGPYPGDSSLSVIDPVSLINPHVTVHVQATHNITIESDVSTIADLKFEAGNDIYINSHVFSNGFNIEIVAGESLIVAPSMTISSRNIQGTDHENGLSIGNSGNIILQGRETTINDGAKIFAHANNGYTAGDISILAHATVSFDWSNALPFLKLKSSTASIVINSATIKGHDIIIKAIASSAKIAAVNWAENQKPTDEITDTVDESFFFKLNAFGGWFDVRTESDVVVNSGAVINASHDVLIRAEALSEITLYSISPIFEFTKAYSSADAQAVVKSGANITAGNDFTLAANVKNTVNFTQATISIETAKVALTLTGTLAEMHSISKAEIENGAVINAVNVEVHALNENMFSVMLLNYDLEVTTFGASIGFVVGLFDSKATAVINGTVTATGDVTVLAESLNTSHALSASASVMNPIKNSGAVGNFLTGWIYDIWNKIKGKLNLDVQKTLGDGKFDVAGTLTFGYGNNEAIAYIGSTAVVNANGNITVKAYALDPLKAAAAGSASAAEVSLGGAILVGVFNNIATAYLADNTTVNAKKKISVLAEATIPNQVDAWISGALPPLAKILMYGYNYEGMKSYPADFFANATPTFADIWNIIYNETMADLTYFLTVGLSYLASGNAGLGKLATTYAQTSAGGDKTKYGAAGAFTLMVINNSATAYIGKGAKVNTDVTYKTVDQSVEVNAITTTNTIDLAGNFSVFSGGIQTTGANIVGGNAAVYVVTNSATAYIDDGATVNAVKDITVKALINTIQIKAVEAASASKNYGATGAVSVSVMSNTAEAYIEDTAVVHADNDVNVNSALNCIVVNVVASDCEVGNSGIGISAAVNSITNTITAFIGNRTTTTNTKGSVYAGHDLTVDATCNSYLSVLSLALADGVGIASKLVLTKGFGIVPIIEAIKNTFNKDTKDNPSDGPNKPNDKGDNFLSGLGIAGDAAVNNLNSTVKAYIKDGVTIIVGNALKVNAQGESLVVSVAVAAASSKKTAVGGVLSWNDVLQTVHAYTEDVTINAVDAAVKKPTITITALAKGYLVTIGVGASVTKEVTVTGAVMLNWVNNDILAALGDKTKVISSGDITINADNLIVFVNVGLAPAVAYSQDSKFSAAGAFGISVLTNSVKSYIGASADITSDGNIVIKANQLTVLVGVDGALAVAVTGGSGGKVTFTLAATLDSKTMVNTILAYIGDSAKVLTTKNILIDAKDLNIAIAVVGGFAGGHKGAGVSLLNNDIIRTLSAYIGKNATVEALGNGDISSLQYHKGIDINASAYDILVGVAIAGTYALQDQGGGAGSVIFNLVVSTVKAYIDSGAHINDVNYSSASDAQDVSIDASNDTFLVGVAGGACLGEKLAFGGAADVNVITKETYAFIGNNATVRAKQDIDILAAVQEWIFSLAAGGSIASSGTTIAAALPVSVLINNTNAYIGQYANVGANGNVRLAATFDRLAFFFNASFALGGDKVAGGLGLNPTVEVNTTKAFIDDYATVYARGNDDADNIYTGEFGTDGLGGSLVLQIPDGSTLDLTWQLLTTKTKNTESFKGLSLTAFSVDDINTTGVGGTVSGGWAVTGTLAPVVIVNDTEASIGKSVTINNDNGSAGGATQGVRIQAFDYTNINSINGEVAFSGNGTGLGAAAAAVVIYKNTTAWVGDFTTIYAKDDIRITSLSSDTINMLGIGLAVATSVGVDGSLGFALIINNTNAGTGTTVNFVSGKDIIISAETQNHVLVLEGAFTYGGTFGWGGSLAPIIIVSATKAELGSLSDIDAAHDVTIKAKTINDIESIVVTGAGGGTAGIAGSLAFNWIESNTIARINSSATVNMGGEVTASSNGQHVTVSAEDRAEIFVIAGAVGGGGTTGVGGSANINVIRSKANATIGENATVYAKDAVTVSALGYKNIKALSISGAGGSTAGVAGAVSIIVIGSKFEDDIRQLITGEDDNGNKVDVGNYLNTIMNADPTHGFLGEYGNLPVGNQGTVSSFINLKVTNNIIDMMYAVFDEPLGDTQASIAKGANVSSLGPIKVTATDDIRIYAAGGSGQGAGTAAVGGAGVGVLINNACKAFIGESAIVNTPGEILVNADSDQQIYDGTVSLGFAGVASVQGSLVLHVIAVDSYAYIGKSAQINMVTVTKGSVIVKATSDTIIVSLGGDFGGAGTAAVGASINVNILIKDTKAYVDNSAKVYSQSDVMIIAVSNEDMTSEIVSGGGAGAASVRGALANNDVAIMTEAFIGNYATVDANGNVLILAEDNTKVSATGFTAMGAAAFSGGAGLGVTVIVKKVSSRIDPYAVVNARGNKDSMEVYTGDIKSILDIPFVGGWFNEFGDIIQAIISYNGSRNAVTQSNKVTASVKGLGVIASSTDDVFTLAAGLGGAIVAITGTGSLQVIATEVEARIGDNASINSDISTAAYAEIYMSAGNHTEIFYGTLGVAFGKVGATVAITPTVIVKKTTASVGGNVQAKGNFTVRAISSQNVDGITIAFSPFGLFFAGAGSVGVTVVANTTEAYIANSAIITSVWGDLIVFAQDDTVLDSIIGSASFGVGGGVGASIGVKVIANTTRAYIGNDAVVNVYDDILVEAQSNEDINSIIAAGGLGGIVGVSAAIEVDVLKSTTMAYIGNSAKINQSITSFDSTQSVTVRAIDNSSILATGGGASIAAGGGVGGFLNVIVLRNSSLAYIGADALVKAAYDVLVDAQTFKTAESYGVAAAGGAGGFAATVNVAAIGGPLNNDALAQLGSNISNVDSVIITNPVANPEMSQEWLTQYDSTSGVSTQFGSVTNGLNVLGDVFATGQSLSSTQAYIGKNAQVTAGHDVMVKATDTSSSKMVSGTFTAGLITLGAAVGVNVVNNTVAAYIDSAAVVNANHNTEVLATIKEYVLTVAGSGAINFSGSGDGSVGITVLTSSSLAYIADGAFINNIHSNAVSGQSVIVKALSDTQVVAVSGAASASFAVGYGIANTDVVVGKTTTAYIGKNASVYALEDITVEANATDNLDVVAASARAAGMGALGGSVLVVVLNNTTQSYVDEKAMFEAGDTISIRAIQHTVLNGVSGVVNLGLLVGVGGAETTIVVGNTTNAFMKKVKSLVADTVLIEANNNENAQGFAVAGGASLTVAVNASVLTISSSSATSAWMSTVAQSENPHFMIDGTITIKADSLRSVCGTGIGLSVSAIAIGATVVDARITGGVAAYVDDEAHIGDSIGSSVKKLDIEAISNDYLKGSGSAPAGGVVAGNAVFVTADISMKTEAFIDKNSVIKTTDSVIVNAASTEKALTDMLSVSGGIAAIGGSVVTANVFNRTHAFTDEFVQITADDITVMSKATNYTLASTDRGSAGGLVVGILATFSTLNTQSWASLGKGTKLTAIGGDVIVEAISNDDANSSISDLSGGIGSGSAIYATLTATIDTAVDIFSNVIIDADQVLLKAYVEKLFLNAITSSTAYAVGSILGSTSTMNVTANASVDVNTGSDITGVKKLSIIATYYAAQAQIKPQARANIALGLVGTVTATSNATVVLNSNVDVMAGSVLRMGELYLEATTSHDRAVSYQQSAAADATALAAIRTAIVTGTFTPTNAVKLNATIYENSTINPRLVINADGTLIKRNVNAYLSGNTIVVESIANDSLSKITIIATSGSVSGNPVIHKNTTINGIEIINNSNMDLILNDILTASSNAANALNITVQAASNTLNYNLITTNTPCSIQITNNTLSDVIFAGSIKNSLGSMNVFNKLGNIRMLPSGLIEINKLILNANNGAIGGTSARFYVNLVKDALDAEISCLANRELYLGLNLFEYKNTDVAVGYEINKAQLKGFLVGDLVDLVLGKGSVIVTIPATLVTPEIKFTRERTARYSIADSFIAGGNVNIAAGTNALLDISGTLVSGLKDIDFVVDASGNSDTTKINYSQENNLTQIIMEAMAAKGGRVDITGAVSGTGMIKVLDGYSYINITNNSAKTLLLNDLDVSSRITGMVYINGVLQSIPGSSAGLALESYGYSKDSIQLITNGVLLQNSGAIKTAQLKFDAAGPVTLNGVNNEVDVISGNSSVPGDIQFTNKKDLEVGIVRGLSGLNAATGNIILNTLNGFMRLSQAVNAGVGSIFIGTAEAAEIVPSGIMVNAPLIGSTVKLVSADGISEDLTGAILADNLIVEAGALTDDATVELNTPANNVSHLAARATGVGKLDFSYTDIDGLEISLLDGITGILLQGGNCSLTAGGLLRGQQISGTADIIANHLSLLTAGGIILETSVSGLTGLNNLSGNINIVNHGDLFVPSLINNAGDVNLVTHSNMTVGNISGNNVTLNAASGSILDDADETNKVNGSLVNLTALVDIGSNFIDGDIDVAAESLSAQAGGDIYLEEENGASFGPISAGGSVFILTHGVSIITSIISFDSLVFKNTSGDIVLATGALTSLNAGVGLFALSGSILAEGPGYHLVAALNSELFAPVGTIGISPILGANPLQVNVNGMLVVTLGGIRVGTESGYLGGVLNPQYNLPILFPVSYPKPLYPYGRVYFNGIKIWPPSMNNPFYLAYLALVSSQISTDFVMPGSEQLEGYRITSMDVMSSADKAGPVYLYHPLTQTDMTAFDMLVIGNDAYQFIDGILQFTGHDGLMDFFEDLEKKKKKE